MGSKLSESVKWLPTLAGYKMLDILLIIVISGVRGEGGGSQGQLEFGLIDLPNLFIIMMYFRKCTYFYCIVSTFNT